MADAQLASAVSSGVGVNDNLTRFFPVAGRLNADATEANAETPVRDAGSFSRLFAFVISNTASVSSTLTLRKSRVDTALTVTIGPDATGIFEDTTNSVAFAATDEVDWELTIPNEAGMNTLTLSLVAARFTPDSAGDCVTKLGCYIASTFSTASTTSFRPPNGSNAGATVEAEAALRMRGSFVASDFYVLVSANARTTNTTFKTRKNGANGGQSVVYGNLETGAKEDISGSDSLAVGDDFGFALTTGTGTESITFTTINVTCLSTAGQFQLAAMSPAALAVSFNTTTYNPAAGHLVFGTTEANSQFYPRFTFTAKELVVYVSANSIATSNTTVTVRDNGVDSSITVSYAPAETGLKNDSTNTAEITSGADEIDYKITTPNTSGTITFRSIGMLGETAVVTLTPVPQDFYAEHSRSYNELRRLMPGEGSWVEFVPPITPLGYDEWELNKTFEEKRVLPHEIEPGQEPPAAPPAPDVGWDDYDWFKSFAEVRVSPAEYEAMREFLEPPPPPVPNMDWTEDWAASRAGYHAFQWQVDEDVWAPFVPDPPVVQDAFEDYAWLQQWAVQNQLRILQVIVLDDGGILVAAAPPAGPGVSGWYYFYMGQGDPAQ